MGGLLACLLWFAYPFVDCLVRLLCFAFLGSLRFAHFLALLGLNSFASVDWCALLYFAWLIENKPGSLARGTRFARSDIKLDLICLLVRSLAKLASLGLHCLTQVASRELLGLLRLNLIGLFRIRLTRSLVELAQFANTDILCLAYSLPSFVCVHWLIARFARNA